MYFKNNTGDESENNLRRAFSDLLITGLTKSKYLKVLSGDKLLGILRQLNLQESESYSSEDLKKVTALGGVTHIVQGNYIKIAEIYRINILLQDARTMELIGTETQEGKEEDFYMMVDELTKKIKTSFELSEKEIADDIDLVDELAAEDFAKGAVITKGDIKPPKLVKSVPPVYPEEARQKRIEGVVIVEARTDKQGNVEAVRILRSIPLLDQAAIDAAKQWKYEPMIINGKATAVVFTITMRFKLKEKKQRTESISEMQWKNSIAVLPFTDLSPQKDQDWFCDGMTDEIIGRLTKLKDLKVIARTSVMLYKNPKRSIKEIGQELGVNTILEGSIRKEGNKIRVSAQLIDVENGSYVWSDTYNREQESVFAIQDEISLSIVDKLKLELLGEQEAKLVKRHTENLEAYNLYLQGRYFLERYEFQKAFICFQQALEKDTNYAPAYVGIAQIHSMSGFFGFFPPKVVYPKATAAVKEALEIDDTLSQAHASLASMKMHFDWDWDGAEREYKRAIELDPGNANAHSGYAMYLSAMGRSDEAIIELKRAQELDPVSLFIKMVGGWIFYYARQYDESIEHFRKTLEMNPNYVMAHIWLGQTYILKKMYEEAIASIQKALILSKEIPFLALGSGWLGTAYAYSGQKDEALKMFERLDKLSKEGYVSSMYYSIICIGLGDKDKAFKYGEKAILERSPYMAYIVAQPIVDPLRSDPRYTELLKKMGLKK